MRPDFGEMLDTSPENRRAYYEMLRRLTPEQRAAKAARLSRWVRDLARSAIAREHPEASESELAARLAVRLYGRDLAARFYPSIPGDAR